MHCKILLTALLTLPLLAYAGVNPKNGNFYITYSDLQVTREGRSLEIKRTYNSKSAELGWFGMGWGSKYETRLIVLPDGSAVVKENGGGRATYYRTHNLEAIKAGVQRIVDAARVQDALAPEAAQELSQKLLIDEELRLTWTVKLGLESELQNSADLDSDCGKAKLVRVPQGYLRTDCNLFGDAEPATDTFNVQGRLIRHELESGYAVMVDRTNSGTGEIHDTLGQSVKLTWNSDGRVTNVAGNGSLTTYSYENKNLASVTDSSGNAYAYSYDRQHNLTRVRYIDGTSLFISYSPRANGMVDAVTERNGVQQMFVYRTDPNDDNHYWTTRTTVSASGEKSTQEYEFQNQTGQTGVTQPSRIAQVGATGSTETLFDDKGRVVRKADRDGGYTDYVYHPNSGKLILVFKDDLSTEFHYDPAGNLVQVANNNGRVIDLTYDLGANTANGNAALIRGMVVAKRQGDPRRELKLNYDAQGHVSEVILLGVGRIHVTYDPKGGIRSVHSKRGSQIAFEVTRVFQALLTAVTVARTQP